MSLERTAPPDPYDHLPPRPSFVVVSDDISAGEALDLAQVHHSAGGGNESPQLSWSGFPPETKSFAVTILDPDAPTGSGWWHWQVVDIPADVTQLATGVGTPDGRQLPPGAVQMRNDYGEQGFGGAGPPPGDMPHRYFVVVHALDTEALGLGPDTPNAIVGFHLSAHALARATLMGTYSH